MTDHPDAPAPEQSKVSRMSQFISYVQEDAVQLGNAYVLLRENGNLCAEVSLPPVAVADLIWDLQEWLDDKLRASLAEATNDGVQLTAEELAKRAGCAGRVSTVRDALVRLQERGKARRCEFDREKGDETWIDTLTRDEERAIEDELADEGVF